MVDIWTEFCGQNSTKCVLNDKLKIQRSMPVSNKRMEEKYMRMKCKRIISLVVIISLFVFSSTNVFANYENCDENKLVGMSYEKPTEKSEKELKSIDVPSNIKNLSNGSSYNFSGSCNASHKLYTNYLIRGAYDYSIVIKNNLGKTQYAYVVQDSGSILKTVVISANSTKSFTLPVRQKITTFYLEFPGECNVSGSIQGLN